MKFGWPISIALHGLLAAGGLIAFAAPPEISQDVKIVPVDLLTLDDFTNIKAAVKAPNPADINPADIPMQLETPMENAEEQGEAQKRVADEVTPPLPQPKSGGEEKVAEKEPPKPPAFDLDSMSELVDKAREAQPEANQQQALKSELNFYEYAQNAREAAGLGDDLTMSELDALQTAMYRCWRIPIDAKNPEELVVRVQVSLRSDGNVQTVTLLDKSKIANSNNPFLNIAAQRAVNAVSKCAPYDFLPLDKYDRWKEMTLRFIPEL